MTRWQAGWCRLAVWPALMLVATASAASAQLRQLGQDMLQACRGRATCSEADFYSGTVSWNEAFAAQPGDGGNGYNVQRTAHVDVVVTSGKVACSGTLTEREKRWSAGRLVVDETRQGVISGPGLIRIEFSRGGTHTIMGPDEDEDVDLDPDTPSYNISITCPSPEVTTTGGAQPSVVRSAPARWGSDGEFSTYDWAGSFEQPALQGTSSWRHPSTDAANGATGTVTVRWALTKGQAP